jgi:hypothetical protein
VNAVESQMLPSVELSRGSLNPALPVRIQVSLFNPDCQGQAFQAALVWLFRAGCRHIEVQLADTLQRFNLQWQRHVRPDRATRLARACGENWIANNRDALRYGESVFTSFRLLTWDHWRTEGAVGEVVAELTNLAENDSRYSAAIERDIGSYFSRARRSLTAARRELSKCFLIEESAVSSYTARFEPANELYAGPQPYSEQYLVDRNDTRSLFSGANFVGLRIGRASAR